MNIGDIIWPHVGKITLDKEALKTSIKQIDDVSWDGDVQTFLEETRRLRDIETARKNGAEAKSQIYLAALLALIPILVSLTQHEALKSIMKFTAWDQILGFIFFVLGIAYSIGAFINAFRALTVKAYHRVDVDEIVSCGGSEDPVECLTKDILKSVRYDRHNINHKVSYVIVTHQLIFRMAFFLLLALSIIVFSPIAYDISEALKGTLCEQRIVP
nr:hypothetical protein [uncultured Cohaesibacter sp.]